MHIAIFTNNYLPNPYGVAGSVESFRKEFEKRGHTVYIFAPEAKGCADTNQNVFRYPSFDFHYKISFPLAIPFSKKIDAILENLRIDVIHAQHPNLLGWAARKWAQKKNVPLVFTWHTLYDKYAHFVPIIPSAWVTKWTINDAVEYANRADVVIVPTESVVPIIQAWGVINEKIIPVATGVAEEEFSKPDRNAIRDKYGIQKDEVLLLGVSRLTEEKNIRFLFETAVEILKKNSVLPEYSGIAAEKFNKAKFMLVGEGNLLSGLKIKTRKEKLEDRIIFPGLIGKKDLKNYYAAGDIFICASKSETQGMNVSEAMYAGLPIVAINASGISSLVKNGGNGVLVEENEIEFMEAVEQLINDDGLRAEMASLSLKIVQEKYTAAICAEKMLTVYEEVIKTNDNKKKLL